MTGIPAIFLVLLAIAAAVTAAIFLFVPLIKGFLWVVSNLGKGIAWLFKHVFDFIYGMISDTVRAFGALITSIILVPLILGNIVIGRWSASGHYGRALQDEIAGVGHCLYRVVIGHPARFLLLSGLTEGIEKRLPQAVAQSPGSDRPSSKTGQFNGYKVIGSLPGGGSGGRLYVAEPDERKRAIFVRAGHDVKQVVIKSFSLSDGASLPQITRENRALEAAKKLRLILDHELSDARFYYVMEFIPGDSLTVVTKRLHSEAGPQGLGTKQLTAAMSMISDLLAELGRYHSGGLWHKDVKPDNIIINQGRAHLVDLGLITPLRSAMTLTTHGTEYFRDPELVRMALRGAKVNEVDGVKFDLYGVGAVLYAVVENSFPAHGGLSQLTKQCPEALRWVVRRAMTELHQRYTSAEQMYMDLRTILEAPDPFEVKPVDLPSVSGGGHVSPEPVAAAEPESFAAAHARMTPPPVPPVDAAGAVAGDQAGRRRPKLGVTDWWTGKYTVRENAGGAVAKGPMAGFDATRAAQDAMAVAALGVEKARRLMDEQILGKGAGKAQTPPQPRGPGRTAGEQLSSAQERVQRAQQRISSRLTGAAYRTSFRDGTFNTEPNKGVAAALFVFLAVAVFTAMMIINAALKERAPAVLGANSAVEPFRVITDRGQVILKSIGTEKGAALLPDGLDGLLDDVHIDLGDKPISDKKMSELNESGQFASDVFDWLRTRNKDLARTATTADKVGDAAATSSAAGGASTEATEVVFRGRILILNVLPSDMSGEEDARLEQVASLWRSRGFESRGLARAEEDTALLASGRRVVELAQPDDVEAVDRVRQWLNPPEPGIDAVLWIGLGVDEGQILRRLITRDGFDSSILGGAFAPAAAPR